MPLVTDDKRWLPKPKNTMELYDLAARCKIVSKRSFFLSLFWPPKEYWMGCLCPQVERIFPYLCWHSHSGLLADQSQIMIHLNTNCSELQLKIAIRRYFFTILGPFCLEKTPLPNLVWLIRTQAILLIDLLSLGKDLLGRDAGCLGI